jgi:hypothetical protein
MTMTGKIPKYGEHFRRESVPGWHPELAQRAYVLKADGDWFIRSDKASERWQVFNGPDRDSATPFGVAQPNFSAAMELLLRGIEQGFYQLAGAVSEAGQHFANDGAPVTPGAKFWDNDLRVVQVTEVASHSNPYPGGYTQTWHRTTHGSSDTMKPHADWAGRLTRRFEGLDAKDYPPGTRYADVKVQTGSRS